MNAPATSVSDPAAAAGANPFAPSKFERRKARRAVRMKWVMFAFCMVLVVPVVAILVHIFVKAAPVLSLDYLWQNPENKGKAGGLWAPLAGTFYLVIGSLSVVAPVGILGAIYLNEYAREGWFKRLISIAVTTLAGVPSIVIALFGLGAFVLGLLPAINRFVADPKDPSTQWQGGLLTASLTIAVMTLPVIITAAREALGAVPQSFREACWNLGATRWQTIRTIVLPNSLGGILTGVILEICRAAGETAPILFTGATFFKFVADQGWEKLFPYNIGEPFMAMSMHLHVISSQISQMPDGMRFGCAAVLILLILSINSFAIVLRIWLRGRKRW
ncbi:MAG: phosphate ABC transporter permease PstA [Verrucomicrobia bacterium]|nr:phosphate ABC transporter permease PstA [Verrucomicrobiota bacterium]